MPALTNTRQELFCQAIVSGKSNFEAYREAGYKPSMSNCSVLRKNPDVIDRIKELLDKRERISDIATSKALQKATVTKQYVIEAAVENLEKALGRKPVKVGKLGEEREVWVYKADAANNTIKMLGAQFGLFADLNVQITADFENLSDPELLQLIATQAKTLLITDETGSQAAEDEA